MQLTESTIAPELTAQKSQDASRLGIVIGGQNVLLSMTDVSEVLPVPPVQAVPLTKHWYLGVTNVRGSLYSVTDIAQFLQWQSAPRTPASRIVLINSVKTTQAAMLIDAVVGLRHVSSMRVLAAEKAESIHHAWLQNDVTCFSSQIYQDHDEKLWFMLDVDAFVQDARFVQPSLA